MTDTTWEKFAHIAGVLALVILIANIYFTHFQGPDLSIQSFPSESLGINQYGIDKDVIFTFKLHNDGGKTAFIEHIFIYQITRSGNKIIYNGARAEPREAFYIDPRKTKEIKITLPAPKAKITNELKIRVWYEPDFKHVESEVIPVSWG